MDARGCALFDTPLGRCGIAWSEHGITRLQLSEGSDAATLARMAGSGGFRNVDQAPAAVREAIALILRLLSGERVDLTPIALDLDGVPEFHQRVFALTRSIAAGQTRSYGELARDLGEAGAARAVGQALGANPCAIIVPCHRVLAADGSLHGFSARGGVNTKQRLLEIERAQAAGTLPLF